MGSPFRLPAEEEDYHMRFSDVIKEASQKFFEAYAEYGDGAADELGLAGQWGDLHRKVKKLKAELWEGRSTLVREDARAVLFDIIGHSLLAIDMLGRGMSGGIQPTG
jgi:hypothetical protein